MPTSVQTSPFAPKRTSRTPGGAKMAINVKHTPPAMSTAATGQVTKVRILSMLHGTMGSS